MDLQQVCRLCSFKLYKPQNIFTTPGLLDKILAFADIEIAEGDGLPCSICDLCQINLRITHEFKRHIGEADKFIRERISEQTSELNMRWRSAFNETNLSNNLNANLYKGSERSYGNDHFQQLPNRTRNIIRRERMRITTRINPMIISRNAKKLPSYEKPLIYSYNIAKSLVASYKASINRCRFQGDFDEFSLPSSFDDSQDEHEREGHFTPADFRGQEKIITPNNDTGTIIDHELPTTAPSRQYTNELLADPLNLLKVRSVQPLHEDDDTNDAIPDNGSDLNSQSSTWQHERPETPALLLDYDQEDSIFTVESSPQSPEIFCRSRSASFSSASFSPSSSSSSSDNFEPVKSNTQRSRGERGWSSTRSTAMDVGERVQAEKNQPSSPLQCPICDKICVGQKGLKVHFRIHWSANCQMCNARTVTKEQFNDHMQVHLTPFDPEAFFPCSICKTNCKTEIGLSIHMRTHSKSLPAGTKCPLCDKSFSTERGLSIHRGRSHKRYKSN